MPIELKYSSEAPPLDEIFQDMQILENYVDERRKEMPLEYQLQTTKSCLLTAVFETINQNDEKSIEQTFQKTIEDWTKDEFTGTCLYWAKYLNNLLNTAGITSHVLDIRNGQFDGTLADKGHAIVIYKLNNNKETTGDAKIKSKPWMVLTCGANFCRRESHDLTLIQYAKDYLSFTKGKFLQLKAETECDPQQIREINLDATNINKLTEPMMSLCIEHLLTPPDKETRLQRMLTLHAEEKNQQK